MKYEQLSKELIVVLVSTLMVGCEGMDFQAQSSRTVGNYRNLLDRKIQQGITSSTEELPQQTFNLPSVKITTTGERNVFEGATDVKQGNEQNTGQRVIRRMRRRGTRGEAHRNHLNGNNGNEIRNHIFQLGRPTRPVQVYDYGRLLTDREKTTFPTPLPTPNIPEDIRQRFFAPLPLPLSLPSINTKAEVQEESNSHFRQISGQSKLKVRTPGPANTEETYKNSAEYDANDDLKTEWNFPNPSRRYHKPSLDGTKLNGIHSARKCQIENDHDDHLKKLLRGVMRLTCKQYINLRRINLLKNFKLELDEKQTNRIMRSCTQLFAFQ